MDQTILQTAIERGESLRQISKLCNTSQTNVRYWLKKFDLKLKRGPKGKKPKDFSFPRKCSCGETDPKKFYGNKTKVCAKCHGAYTLAKGQENRLYMLEKLGGHCINCGFDKFKSSLDIHHLDPNEKDVAFGTVRYWKRDKIDKELEKCVILCRNCHSAYHNGELEIDFKISV